VQHQSKFQLTYKYPLIFSEDIILTMSTYQSVQASLQHYLELLSEGLHQSTYEDNAH